MTCQYLSAVCVLCSLFMTSSVKSRSLGPESHVIAPVIIHGPNFFEYFSPDKQGMLLPCVATGSQPIVYNWFRNGAAIAVGANVIISDGTLTLNHPTRSMEGYYQCFASNDAGVAMSNITVFQAAVLESSQSHRRRMFVEHRSVPEADPVILPCSHVDKSIPRPKFGWIFSTGSDFLPVRLDDRISQTDSGSLVFSFVRKNDSAQYKCEAYNRILLEFLYGSNVNLTVESKDTSTGERKTYEPPVILFSSSTTTIVETEDLTLNCLFGSWPEGFDVEWTVPTGSSNMSGSSITIRNTSIQDEGHYTCRARKTTPRGTLLFSEMVNISVQVDAIPSFAVLPTNQEIVVGQRATFTCQGQGRPSPIVTWYANGTSLDEINDASRIFTYMEGSTSFLMLMDINATATVSCNISNVHGYRLHTAVITFTAKIDHDDIRSPSSQTQVISTWKPTEKQSIKSTNTSTKPYEQLSIGLNQTISLTEPGKPAGFLPTHSPQSSETAFVTNISVGVVVGLIVVIVVIIVAAIIYVRRRKERREVETVVGNNQQRQEVLVLNNERVYDSDDSGFDDLRTENSERRNIRRS